VQVVLNNFFVFLANILVLSKKQRNGGDRYRRFISEAIVEQLYPKKLKFVPQEGVLLEPVHKNCVFSFIEHAS
jgi:hypothetical protein